MSKVSLDASQNALGIETFQALRAEEEPWLDSCFVPPHEYGRLSSPASILVFGADGTGKSALYNMLRKDSAIDEGKGNRLIVDWRPDPLSEDKPLNVGAVQSLAWQVVDAVLLAMLRYLGDDPERYYGSPNWAQERIKWAIRKTWKEAASLRVEPVADEFPSDGADLLRKLLVGETQEILHSPSPDAMIDELVKANKHFGLSGIWVMCDGLGGWAEVGSERLGETLKVFLSALVLFENKGISFKFFLPGFLKGNVTRASSTLRRRIETYDIHWSPDELRQIVENRLSFAMGRKGVRLKDLCGTAPLAEWLERVGGDSPRDWLDQTSPLVKRYLSQSPRRPIDVKTWQALLIEHPPRFWMDEVGRRVRVGGREVPLNDIPPKAYEMLKYLYQNSGEIVGKDQLYYLVYLGMDRIPRSKEDDQRYLAPMDYAGIIDTSIYRLRKAIEPNPDDPILIQTVRGYGLKLVSR